jgi:hypothetical protein
MFLNFSIMHRKEGTEIRYVSECMSLFKPINSTELARVNCLISFFCFAENKQYFRDPRCLTDLVRCCVILDSIQVSSPLVHRDFTLFPFAVFLYPVQVSDRSRLVAFCVSLCVFLCACMCVWTCVSVHSLTAKVAGCLQMP